MTPTVQQMRARQMLWVPTDIQITRPAQKGDVAGHGFHGNRYTGGIGGEEPVGHPVNLSKNTRSDLIKKLLADAGAHAVTSEDYMHLAGKYLMAEQDMDAMKPEEYRTGGGKARADKFYALEETMGEYETTDSWLMNQELRAGHYEQGLPSHTLSEMDECFKEFGGSFEDDKVVFRGAVMEEIPQKGEVYHDEAFVSTINTPDDAIHASSKTYTDAVSEAASPVTGSSTVWEITIPKGSECLAVRPDEYKSPADDSFQEIVLPRGADLVVDATKTIEGVTFIKASYLGSTPKQAAGAVPDPNHTDHTVGYQYMGKAAPTVPPGREWRFLWMPGDMTITRPDAKGDASGHAFHGNRYTGGIGGEMPTLSNGHDPKLIAAIDEATAKIKTLNHERAYVFAKDGKPIAVMEGGTSTVRATNRQVGEIATAALDGGIVGLHNHPGGQGTSFSPADVATGFKFGFSEIRVMADPWVYVMRPGKAATPSGGFDRGRGYMALDRAEELSSKEGLTWHEVWRQVAAEQDLEYFRVHTGDAARFLSPTAGEAAIAQHQAS